VGLKEKVDQHGERREKYKGEFMSLIPAIKKDGALLREMDEMMNDGEQFSLWWLGQSGYVLQWKRKRVVIDPYLSDSLTRKYAATEKPHTRMSELVLDPSLLRGVTVVSSSHNHTDHLDADTLIPLFRNNPGAAFIIPEANREFVAERLHCDKDFPLGLNEGSTVSVGEFRFHGIAAKHNEIDRDESGNCKYMGYVIEFGKNKIYHSGDTLWYDEMVNAIKPFGVDVAILPINGNEPSRKVAGNLNCREAALLGKEIAAKCVIPCHYDMFSFNTANPADFVREAEALGLNYQVLKGGGRFDG
jgi:L-ascorbate metabolism protein UlaG (beta-lactamase superfamily)